MAAQTTAFSLLAVTPPQGVKLDPKDPKTWWLASAANEPNRIPVSAQMHDHCMILARVPAKRFYYEAEVNVNVGAAVAAYYSLDSPRAVGDVYNYEVEALGQKMIYGKDSMPDIDPRNPLIKESKDLLKLKVPDWLGARRIRYALEVIKLTGEMGVERGSFCAPFSMAVGLRTYPKLIRDMRRDPTFAHDLFTFLVDEILPSYLEVQKNYCGVSSATGADAWAAFPNLTPELVEEWVLPYAMRLRENCLAFGMKAITLGGGDYCEEQLEKFDKNILYKCLDVQVKLFAGTLVVYLGMGRWHEYPLEAVAEYLAQYKERGIHAAIFASVNARLLRDGPVNKIVDTVKRFIDVLGRDHNLLVLLANIPADTPPQHVHAAVAAVHTYGRLPIAKNLDEVEFQVPERESFQEYVKKMSEGAGLSI